MVSCFKCGKALPHFCTCGDSLREKRLRMLRLAIRESELILKIVADGYVPRVTFGEEEINPTIEIDEHRLGLAVKLSFQITPSDWRKYRTMTLYDSEGLPLYRRKMGDLFKARKGDTLIVEAWRLSIGANVESVTVEVKVDSDE